MVSGSPLLAAFLQTAAQKLPPGAAYKFLGLLILIAGMLVVALVLIRHFFKKVAKEIEAGPDLEAKPATDQQSAFVVATFQQVIQKMKEQEKELERLHKMERQRGDESQQLTAAILKNLPTAVVIVNPRGQIIECNPAAQALLGHQILLGRHYREILWPEYRAGLEASDAMVGLEACLREGKPSARLPLEYRAPGPASAARNVEMDVSPVPAPEGASGGAICLLFEVPSQSRPGL